MNTDSKDPSIHVSNTCPEEFPKPKPSDHKLVYLNLIHPDGFGGKSDEVYTDDDVLECVGTTRMITPVPVMDSPAQRIQKNLPVCTPVVASNSTANLLNMMAKIAAMEAEIAGMRNGEQSQELLARLIGLQGEAKLAMEKQIANRADQDRALALDADIQAQEVM